MSTNPETTRKTGGASSRFRQHPLSTLREEVDDMLTRFAGRGAESWLMAKLSPAVDVSETDAAVEVYVDLPGVNPDEIDIHLTGNTLTLRGERPPRPAEEKDRTFHRVERWTGEFNRRVVLPCEVNEKKVDAKYQQGVLMITLSKPEQAKGHRIRVKSE